MTTAAVVPRHHAVGLGMQHGHALRVTTDAHEAWLQLCQDLDQARTAIHICVYILADDAVGQRLRDRLIAALARGVLVRLDLDAVGCLGLSQSLLRPLAAAGGEIYWFEPLGPHMLWLKRWWRRNHRKIVLIDSALAWVSGRNFTEQYYALTPTAACWADVSARVTGPAVADIARELAEKRRRPAKVGPPSQAPADGEFLTVAFNRGGLRRADANRRYLQAVRQAKQIIYLANAYFLPQWALERALTHAARQGVRIYVTVPHPRISDVPLVGLASMHAVSRLLKRGIAVYAMRQTMLHAKICTVDGHWWTLGSANLDPISRQRNLEANLVGLGAAPAAILQQYQEELHKHADLWTHERYLSLPRWRRALAAMAWLLRAFL